MSCVMVLVTKNSCQIRMLSHDSSCVSCGAQLVRGRRKRRRPGAVVSWALHAAAPALCHSPAVLQPQGHDGGQGCPACRRGRQSASQGERVGLPEATSSAARPPAPEGAAARPGELSCLCRRRQRRRRSVDRVFCHLQRLPAPAETVGQHSSAHLHA